MSGVITHRAEVIDVMAEAVDVLIYAEGACGSCVAKGACDMGESQQKVIRVDTLEAPLYRVGEIVQVSIEQSMGIKAIFLAYMFPFLLVFTILLTVLQFGLNELFSGLIALVTLVFYYIVLYLFRDRVAKEISFRVNKI